MLKFKLLKKSLLVTAVGAAFLALTACSSTGTGAPTVAGTAGTVTVAVILAKSIGAALNESLVKAFTTDGLPVTPETLGGLSSVANKVAATTFTVSVAILQLVGFSNSQIL